MWRSKQLQYTWLRSLMGRYTDFWEITGNGLDYALAAHDIDDPDIRKRLMDLYMTLDAYQDAVSTLQQLKDGGYATGILSNGSPDMLNAAVDASGLRPLLDAVLSVHEVGIFKPSAKVYEMALDRFGVAADEICFVSANAWDAAGAADFGFQVAHLKPVQSAPGTSSGQTKSDHDVAVRPAARAELNRSGPPHPAGTDRWNDLMLGRAVSSLTRVSNGVSMIGLSVSMGPACFRAEYCASS